ncbi:MAG TPA: FkbM family methyltransferase [Verrucomicrobiae bacterium]|nr:FkbM family methyltransferase [Verrucomicrobiae bacterium]
MRNLPQLLSGFRNRSRIMAKKINLYIRWRAAHKTLWVDYGWMRLPFHGDGDMQEVFYHLNGNQWWRAERALLSRYLKPGHVAVDVGANLGFVAGILSNLVGPEGRVHSFEPSPTIHAKLVEVIQANAYANVSTYNVGCGESEGRMTLHCAASSGNSTLRSGIDPKLKIRSTQDVRIVRLDDFLATKLTRLDLLKIDTEGFEDSVLAGTVGLLQKFKPAVYVELSSEYLSSSQRAVKVLQENGYFFEQEPQLKQCHNGENFLAFHESKGV